MGRYASLPACPATDWESVDRPAFLLIPPTLLLNGPYFRSSAIAARERVVFVIILVNADSFARRSMQLPRHTLFRFFAGFHFSFITRYGTTTLCHVSSPISQSSRNHWDSTN